MPKVTVNGDEYFYEDKGSGFPIVFGNSLLFDHRMWAQQVETLSSRYRPGWPTAAADRRSPAERRRF